MANLFLERLKEKVLIFDGAMGTNLQNKFLTPEDFGSKDGCNEYLVITKPDAILQVHRSFFEVGCDVVETDTFGANRIVLGEYDLAHLTHDINKKAALIAREAAEEFSKSGHRRFVAGSIGPGTKLPSLGHIGFDELKSVFKEQIAGLIDGGVDVLLIETCQDLLQAKIAAIAAEEFFTGTGRRVPVMVQMTFERTGTMLLGTEMPAAIAALEMLPIDILGMNCATGPLEMADPLRALCEYSMKPISALPNAGLPENVGGVAHYRLTPRKLADFHERFVKEFGVSIVGGCCGTTPEHLKAVVDRVRGLKPKKRTPKHEPSASSLYTAVSYAQNPPPLLVGERTNANGSRKFKELLEREDYDAMVSMGREAVKEGAHFIDVCVAYVGRDETKDMIETISRFNQQITLPIMIDSTEAPVIEEALKRIGGKSIINSINLEDGEERMLRVCPLAKKYGAALVALTIDEKGMAKTAAEKVAIAKRIHKLATEKYGILTEDLFFDTLTFTLGSGDAEFRKAGIETIEAIRQIKKEIPGVRTLLGVSNISFGLDPLPRQVLNSVFLDLAIQAGLDGAIVNAQKILPLHKIAPEEIELCKKLVLDDHSNGNPLTAFLAYFDKKKGTVRKEKAKTASTVEESLKNKIIDGDKENLENELKRAMEKYKPLEIINTVLLDGMKVVGDLFGSGKMQLPFVLQSAEVMKKAVAYLEQFMEKVTGQEKGIMVLATVKGDVHDIGKNLVDIILTNNGYKVINLGIKQPIDNILNAAAEHNADAIGLSGLLVKSTAIMKEDLEEMNRRGISMPVICGGAALTRKYVEEDLAGLYHGEVYYGQDAFSGLRIMNELTNPERAAAITKTIKARGAKMENLVEEKSAAVKTRSNVTYENAVPKAPFLGYKILTNIRLEEVYAWINEIALFRGQWQFRQGQMSREEYSKIIKEKVEPLFQELKAKCVREKILEPRVIYGYYPCYSEGNDLVILDEKASKEKVRFTFPRQVKEPYHCLSDFFRPKNGDGSKKGEGSPDQSGGPSPFLDLAAFQVVTVGQRASDEAKKLFEANKYTDYLYLHGLSVECAEALAEYTHTMIRKELGIGEKDSNTREEVFRQGYQGSRYSFGYPACPNLEDQVKLFQLVPAEKVKVALTEEFQLVPEQSTSAIVVHHPRAKYFNI